MPEFPRHVAIPHFLAVNFLKNLFFAPDQQQAAQPLPADYKSDGAIEGQDIVCLVLRFALAFRDFPRLVGFMNVPDAQNRHRQDDGRKPDQIYG